MQCLDCRTESKDTHSVGVCQGCGAGVCESHARITSRTVRHGSPQGPCAQAEARRVLCTVCAEAEALTAAAVTL
ncbi:DUF2180 family protein [Streptomyces flavidovirens]|uniref:DUF2180 family protein n=1 Tax=Streptomyces flavidovirens TaxID=67298 RepID=UPI00342719C2